MFKSAQFASVFFFQISNYKISLFDMTASNILSLHENYNFYCKETCSMAHNECAYPITLSTHTHTLEVYKTVMKLCNMKIKQK